MLEFQIKEESRRQAVEHAKKVAHDHMDHVKAFHTGMMLSDVLHEREIQKNHRIRKQETQKEIDRQWELTEMATLEAHDEKMKTKLVNDFKRKQETAQILRD